MNKTLMTLLSLILFLGFAQSYDAQEVKWPDVNQTSAIPMTSVSTKIPLTDQSFQATVMATIDEFGLDSDNVSVSFYDFKTKTHYYLNADLLMLGASTTKIGTAALYTQLISEGYLNEQTLIPFIPDLYEEGNGNITNGPKESAYPIWQLIEEMLYYSDNTAWNLLTHYYYENFGNYQEDLLYLSGAEIISDEMYTFNVVNATVLEGLLIELASNDIYQPVVDIMTKAQENYLMRTYLNEGMATKYGYFETYFHDVGLYFEGDQPVYALAILTQDLSLDAQGIENDFFGTLNLRLHDWADQKWVANH